MFVWLLLFHAIATVFQIYHGSDMMSEMRRKPEYTLSLNQEFFNLPHHIWVSEELAFADTVSYTQKGNGLQHSYIYVIAVTMIRTPVPRVTYSML